MKTLVTFFILFTMTQAFAQKKVNFEGGKSTLTCTGIDSPELKISLNLVKSADQNLAHGTLIGADLGLALAGSFKEGIGISTYELVDHKGVQHFLTVKEEFVFPDFQHCRARICHGSPIPPQLTANLSSGEDLEYFNCL